MRAMFRGPTLTRHPSHQTHESSIHQVIPYALKQFKQKGIKSVTAAKCLTKQPR